MSIYLPAMSIRNFALILFLLLSITPAHAGDFTEQPPPADFRGIAWGTPLEQLTNMIPVPAKGYKDTYYLKEEPLTFGEAKIVSVSYYFKEEKLVRVGVAFQGQTNLFFIKEKLIREFGPGQQRGMHYGWTWSEFSMDIAFETSHDMGALHYNYEPLPERAKE